MLSARERIERQMSDPALVRLHRKLSRLTSVLTMMNTGAHPDDEQNGMLAWLRLGLGMRVIIACSTRGEGGQNALGPERLGALGVLRSRELEEAARVLDSDVHWLGHGPADEVHDFGFSKDGDATFDRWGEKRIIERLVRAYRRERPDIVVPTFLDVPGQHGHHRAMTRAAEAAIELAADETAFPHHFEEGLAPWKVAKYYLPAWSGGGDTYDDEVPPPDATLMLKVSGREPATGADYDRIGEWSRYYHASQGMGRWPEQPKDRWPLHLKLGGRTGEPEASIHNGLPASLAALAEAGSLPSQIAAELRAAHEAITQAIASFPDRDAITRTLLTARGALHQVSEVAPDDFLKLHGHRIERKLTEIDAAILEAQGIFDRAYAEPSTIVPGGRARLIVELGDRAANREVEITPHLPQGVSASLDALGKQRINTLSAAADAPLSNLYSPAWSSLGGNGQAYVEICADIDGQRVKGVFDLEESFLVTPRHSLTLQPDALIVPLGGSPRGHVIKAELKGSAGTVTLETGADWKTSLSDGAFEITLPQTLAPGLFEIATKVDGAAAHRTTPVSFRHIGHAIYHEPVSLKVLSLDLKLPEGARIGYVGGGADRVGSWMARMGLNVVELDASALSGDLSGYTTIVVGIFAFGLRTDLVAATRALHRFVVEGGHLLTLYHRPTDGWNPDETPVRPLEIGSPSLRWRVTDPHAEVTVLEPDHVLLNGPNRIEAADWAGWNKERGLYFASRWDDAYVPLLAMHDANEQPLKGALLSAEIGKGRHTHTSLVLHHQMDKLVPGAFRLLANLVQPV